MGQLYDCNEVNDDKKVFVKKNKKREIRLAQDFYYISCSSDVLRKLIPTIIGSQILVTLLDIKFVM